jgi:hypothetical protein
MTEACPRCGDAWHHPLIQCPYVKAVTFADDGVRIVRVEFLTLADMPQVRGAPGADQPDDYPKLGRS